MSEQSNNIEQLLLTIIDRLHGFETQVNSQFEQIDSRFERMERRFEQIDARFEQIASRFEQIDARFEQMESRFEQIDARFVQVDGRFEQIDSQFNQVNSRLDNMQSQLDRIEASQAEDVVTILKRIDHKFTEVKEMSEYTLKEQAVMKFDIERLKAKVNAQEYREYSATHQG